MPKLTIDGQEVEVPQGSTVFQACQSIGIEIPHFCYHPRLQIAGNCRMCLVEVEKSPKPVASCAMPAADGMVVHTRSPKAEKARHGVMEFLLINHPLDCPICDQGGECDLQDESMSYGFDRGRFHEDKRSVKDKDLGPLVKTSMNRCIQCTRCVRFAQEIAGVEELGATGRGEHMEIGTYVEHALTSELSANIIDICPVGALTSKPYAYVARPWELRKTESIDVMDAVGSNIRVDSRGPQVLRVLPRIAEDINEEWISDKTRYAAADGLLKRRLDRPYVRRYGKLQEASWAEALETVASKLKGTGPEKIAAIAGDLVDCEAMFALKSLLGGMGVTSMDCRQDGAQIGGGDRGDYLFNTTIAGIEQADACLIVGSNPRWEAALINARLRKRYLAGGFKVAAIGPQLQLTFPVLQLGEGTQALADLLERKGPGAELLTAAQRPMLILGSAALTGPEGAAIHALARHLAVQYGMVRDEWNGFNVLHRAASRVGGLDLGFLPGAGGRDTAGILAGAEAGDVSVLYLLGADEIDTTRLGSAFVIYQGHTGDAGAARADVILPGAAYTEKNGVYVNTEGRVQMARMAVFPPGEAREDWKILRALSDQIGKTLPFDTLPALRAAMVAAYPSFGHPGEIQSADWQALSREGSAAVPSPVMRSFSYPIDDFYQTDPISRASATMAACSEAKAHASPLRTGTFG